MIEKQMYKLKLGVDELNEDVMKCYYRKTNVIENYINDLKNVGKNFSLTETASIYLILYFIIRLNN